MEAGKLIELILEAGEKAKDVIPYFLGKPYTATSVCALEQEVHLRLEGINRVLRTELGIELYVDVVPTVTDTTVQGYLKVKKCGEFRIEEPEVRRNDLGRTGMDPRGNGLPRKFD